MKKVLVLTCLFWCCCTTYKTPHPILITISVVRYYNPDWTNKSERAIHCFGSLFHSVDEVTERILKLEPVFGTLRDSWRFEIEAVSYGIDGVPCEFTPEEMAKLHATCNAKGLGCVTKYPTDMHPRFRDQEAIRFFDAAVGQKVELFGVLSYGEFGLPNNTILLDSGYRLFLKNYSAQAANGKHVVVSGIIEKSYHYPIKQELVAGVPTPYFWYDIDVISVTISDSQADKNPKPNQ